MSWIFFVGLAVVIAGLAGLTGIKPKGTKPVANTRLMGIARFILLFAALILLLVGARYCSSALAFDSRPASDISFAAADEKTGHRPEESVWNT